MFSLELRLDADYAHKAACRRSTSGGVVMCAGTLLCIVFLLGADTRYAVASGTGV